MGKFTFIFGYFSLYGQGNLAQTDLLFVNWKVVDIRTGFFHEVFVTLSHVFCTEVKLRRNFGF